MTVVISHFVTLWRPHILPDGGSSHLFRRVAQHVSELLNLGGGLAVTLFFVLSGMVLMYNYGGPDGRLRTSARSFYVARIARIYPVYVLGLLVAWLPYVRWHECTGGASNCAQSNAALNGGASLALLQAWDPLAATFWNGPAWSLSVEAFFYALFPILLPLLSGRTVSTLQRWCVALCLVALAFPVLYWIVLPDGPLSRSNFGSFWFSELWANPLVHLPEFVLGMALIRIVLLRRENIPHGHREWRALALLAADLAIVIVFLPYFGFPLALYPLSLVLALPAIGYLLFTLAQMRGPVSRVLSHPWLQALGEASYALYLLHWPVWLWWTHLLHASPTAGGRLSGLLLFGGYLCLVIPLSLAVFYGIEQPMRRLIRQTFDRPRATPGEVPEIAVEPAH
ncbi:MAG: mdmB [Chloroflexi bacterium]|nr:mdmB [Chloroflexota bacterium]